jgi:hypothetical protein
MANTTTTTATMAMSADPPAIEAPEKDRTIAFVTGAIGVCTLGFAVLFAFVATLRFSLGVTVGGAIGLLNFVVLAQVGKALSGSRRRAAILGVLYLVKVLVLFGGVFFLFRAGWLPGLSIVVGLSALVPGIVVGGLLATPRDPTNETASKS